MNNIEKENLEKIKKAKTGEPITLSGHAVIGLDGKDTGKVFIKKKDAEAYLEMLRRIEKKKTDIHFKKNKRGVNIGILKNILLVVFSLGLAWLSYLHLYWNSEVWWRGLTQYFLLIAIPLGFITYERLDDKEPTIAGRIRGAIYSATGILVFFALMSILNIRY